MIDWHQRSWQRTTLLTDRAVRLSNAKTYVFSDSVLCMGGISSNPVKAWKEKNDWFMNSSQCREWNRIDGEPMETISQDSLHYRFSPRFRTLWLKYNVNLSNLQDESSSCQCTITLYGRKRKQILVYCEFQNRGRICKKIRARTLVVSRSWIRNEMARNSYLQPERRVWSCRWGHDDQLQWKRTSRAPWIQCFGTMKFEKQRRWKIVYLHLWWYRCSRSGWFIARSFPSISSVSDPRIRRTPAHVIFLAWLKGQDLSHRVSRNRCVPQHSHGSHPAQHVARALLVVSFTLEHYLAFHMHSSPTFYPTIHPTFVAAHFTRRFILRGSIESVFRLPGWNARSCRSRAQRSHWNEQYRGHTNVLPQTEHDVDWWFSSEHSDSPSWIGLEWWANTEHAGFTTVHTGERNKCRPITSLSLLQTKLSVQFISLPRTCRGNLPQCSHTQESRVKRDFPTEKPFPKDINQFKERTKLYLGSLIRKKLWD